MYGLSFLLRFMHSYYCEQDGTKILSPDTLTYYYIQQENYSVNLIHEKENLNMESVIPILVFLLGILLISIIVQNALRDEKRLASLIEKSNRSLETDFEKVKTVIITSNYSDEIAVRRLIKAFCAKHQKNTKELPKKKEELINLFKEKYNDTIF